MNYDDWLEFGMQQGFISKPWCWVHDAPALTDEENAIVEADEGDYDGICVFAVRLTPDVT